MWSRKHKELRPTINIEKTFMEADSPYVTAAVSIYRELFSKVSSIDRYTFYQIMIERDPELAGAIDAKATFIAKTLGGFRYLVGETKTKREEEISQELERLHRKLRKYYYDIAYKVIRDGNACYLIQLEQGNGISKLEYLPMNALTCVESEEQKLFMELPNVPQQIFKRGVYILSENTAYEKRFPASSVAHFDLGRQDAVYDNCGRYTLGVWNVSPLESLKGKLLWKEAIILADMLWRERMVPREHHKLPSEPFDPNLYPGKTMAEKIKAANQAVENAVKEYTNKLYSKSSEIYPRPDRGYVTLDNVEISVVESKTSHTDPNALLEQIDKSIYSVITPESTVSAKARSTYGSEVAVMLYTTLKAERIAEAIAEVLIDLAKLHLRNKSGFEDAELDNIDFMFNKLLDRHSIVRDSAILLETGAFTPAEVRAMMGFPPLSEADRREIEAYFERVAARRRHTTSLREIAAAGRRSERTEQPVTPHSEHQQQLT